MLIETVLEMNQGKHHFSCKQSWWVAHVLMPWHSKRSCISHQAVHARWKGLSILLTQHRCWTRPKAVCPRQFPVFFSQVSMDNQNATLSAAPPPCASLAVTTAWRRRAPGRPWSPAGRCCSGPARGVWSQKGGTRLLPPWTGEADTGSESETEIKKLSATQS